MDGLLPSDTSHGTGLSPSEVNFDTLLRYLGQCGRVDLQDYHRQTLMKRMQLRMDEIHVHGFEAYQRYLIDNENEYAALTRRIYVNHTAFFRDINVWELLSTLLPALFSAKAAEDPIRMWSAGCASGEEAYSLAMLAAQILGEEEFRRRVRIVATDVDQRILAQARAGSYCRDKMEAIGDGRRGTYFDEIRGRYVFRPDLRKTIIFGVHDLLRDPPFCRMDVVLCRNTLMYFKPQAQARVVSRIHDSVRPGGYLILGKAERSRDTRLFTLLNYPCVVYSRISPSPMHWPHVDNN